MVLSVKCGRVKRSRRRHRFWDRQERRRNRGDEATEARNVGDGSLASGRPSDEQLPWFPRLATCHRPFKYCSKDRMNDFTLRPLGVGNASRHRTPPRSHCRSDRWHATVLSDEPGTTRGPLIVISDDTFGDPIDRWLLSKADAQCLAARTRGARNSGSQQCPALF